MTTKNKPKRLTHGFSIGRYFPLFLFDIKYDYDYKLDKEIVLKISLFRIQYCFYYVVKKYKHPKITG
jgi:hypothetical protein